MSIVSDTCVKLEVGLRVGDLNRSSLFYATFFHTSPVRTLAEYVLFDVEFPPVLLTLRPGHVGNGVSLNHLGFRLESAEELLDWQRRLELAGVATDREDHVECCYSQQSKFWIKDPDGHAWEIYVPEEEDDHSASEPETAQPVVEPVVWGLRCGEPCDLPWALESNSIDELFLEPVWEQPGETTTREVVLREACRVLKPGGSIELKLKLSRDLESANPGKVASSWLHTAGFRALQIEALQWTDSENETPQMRISGIAPLRPTDGNSRYQLMYLGPAAQLEWTSDLRLPRGVWVDVTETVWTIAQMPVHASQFSSRLIEMNSVIKSN